MIRNFNLINFVDLSMEEKKMVLMWRNNQFIKEYMYNKNDISLNEHLSFIDSLKESKNKLYFVVKDNNNYIGVIDFVEIIEKKSLSMGIYGNPNIKGVGKKLLELIIYYSKNILNVEEVHAEVFERNIKAYNLYLTYGFKMIGKKEVCNETVKCLVLNLKEINNKIFNYI